jgi:hypothetical protein
VLEELRSDLIDPAISAHHGRVVKRTGDGAIVEFRSVVDAVRCAIELQRAVVERNAEVAPALKETASYVQKDGKTVTVDAKGRMRRTLPSGARDPEPIARIVRPHKRVREELIRRLVVSPGRSRRCRVRRGHSGNLFWTTLAVTLPTSFLFVVQAVSGPQWGGSPPWFGLHADNFGRLLLEQLPCRSGTTGVRGGCGEACG